MAIGRSIAGSSPANFLNGWVDEVRVFSRTISVDEVAGIVSEDGGTAGTWRLDGNVVDSSGQKENGSLGCNPERAAGQASSPDPSDLAVKLNGSSKYVTRPHPLDTGTSFSVADFSA